MVFRNDFNGLLAELGSYHSVISPTVTLLCSKVQIHVLKTWTFLSTYELVDHLEEQSTLDMITLPEIAKHRNL